MELWPSSNTKNGVSDGGSGEALDFVRRRNLHEALKVWTQNIDSKNTDFQNANQFLLERREQVSDLVKMYEADLKTKGAHVIEKVVGKYTEGEELSGEEQEIFTKALIYSSGKVFLALRTP